MSDRWQIDEEVFSGDILAGDQEGSIFRLILFIFFFLDWGGNYFTNYADGTTPYVVGDNTTDVLNSLTKIAQELFTWFANSKMKTNQDKVPTTLEYTWGS